MTHSDDNEKESRELVRSLLLDPSDEQTEKLLRQMLVLEGFSRDQLAAAKVSRAEAERAREQAEAEIVQTTRELCDHLRTEAQRELDRARELKAEAERTQLAVQRELERAKELRTGAESYREKIVAEAQKQAQEILDHARALAEEERADLKRQALEEIKKILTDIDTIRAAAQEQIEAQRILTSVAQMRAASSALAAQVPGKPESAMLPAGSPQHQNGALPPAPQLEPQLGSDSPAAAGDVEPNATVPPTEPVAAEHSSRPHKDKKAEQTPES